MSNYFKGLFARRSLAAIAAAALLSSTLLFGCGKGDPEENFRLWSNNEAGWTEMANYVADQNNEMKLRLRALEVLIDEGGQPSQALRVAAKAADKKELLVALQPWLQKMLETEGNATKQAHAKQVLFDMIGDSGLPEDKKAAIRKGLAKWAFADLTPEDSTQRIKDKLETRMSPQEIQLLGEDGAYGAELMLSKGLARESVMQMLQASTSVASKQALINGLRRYHKLKNVKVGEGDLAAIQKADCAEGFGYFIELYSRLSQNRPDGRPPHQDDKAAASQAVMAAILWSEKPDNQAKIKAGWEKLKPTFDALLVTPNADDRWWAADVITTAMGLDGVREVLTKLPNDENYGKGEFAQNDVKKQITDFCTDKVKPLGGDKVRPLLETSLKSLRVFERIVALRCLVALGDAGALATLKAVDKKDPINGNKLIDKANPANAKPDGSNPALTLAVDAMVVPAEMSGISVYDLARCGADVVEYSMGVDKLAAEGKIDAATAKARKTFAGFSFDRGAKTLGPWAEARAADKVAADKAKAAAPKK